MKYRKAVIVGCDHKCPMYDGDKAHVGGPTIKGAKKVFIEKKPACRKGDKLRCKSPKKDKIKTASKTVFIEKKRAARTKDTTKHGGIITKGAKKVYIG